MKLVLCLCICVVLVIASSPVPLSDSSPSLGWRWLQDAVIVANGPAANTTTSFGPAWSQEPPAEVPCDGSKRLSPGGPNPQHH
ncbi:hypothetical protein SEVIR_4G139300v4 [Setaria viridis]|uniref:Uncharacterized protein n=2 Tax=Setaria TaxID=4554 RepID=K3Y0G7_SETIT|nr:hypothetical protein SETIT_4G170800v2 [Setaria italica]TKW21722.1 hypothetical protein SEVIR_4G139300v2 [Setaria viridis]